MYLDTNENIETGRIAKMFRAIGLIETTKLFYSGLTLATFIKGQH
jgi:hypothetical protein